MMWFGGLTRVEHSSNTIRNNWIKQNKLNNRVILTQPQLASIPSKLNSVMWIIFLYPVVLGVKQFVHCCKKTNKTFTNLGYPFSCLPRPFPCQYYFNPSNHPNHLMLHFLFFSFFLLMSVSHTYTHFLFGSFLHFLTSILIFLSHYAHFVNIVAFSKPNSCSHKEWPGWLSNLNLSFNRKTPWFDSMVKKSIVVLFLSYYKMWII